MNCDIRWAASRNNIFHARMLLMPRDGAIIFAEAPARDLPSFHNRGYSQSREQGMADFKKQWLDDLSRRPAGRLKDSNNRPAAPIPPPYSLVHEMSRVSGERAVF
jgi:hypothetical protein